MTSGRFKHVGEKLERPGYQQTIFCAITTVAEHLGRSKFSLYACKSLVDRDYNHYVSVLEINTSP